MSVTSQTPPARPQPPELAPNEPDTVAYPYRREPISMDGGLYAFGETLGVFGSNAPMWQLSLSDASWDSTDDPWTVWKPYEGANYQGFANCDIALDRVVPALSRGGWITLELPQGTFKPFWIEHAFERAFAGFALSGRVSALRLRRQGDTNSPLTDLPAVRGMSSSPQGLQHFTLRETTVHAASELLTLVPVPDPASVGNTTRLELETLAAGLGVGQRIFLHGIDPTTKAPVSELAEISALQDVPARSPARTRLTLRAPLSHAYERTSLVINANVVEATHGEVVTDEVLGSGDASAASQSFALRRGPLSTRPDAGALDGGDTTLSVYVDGIAWRRVASPLEAGPTDAVYWTRTDLDGRPRLVFGDGTRGRRLSTGVENVRATYRAGAGTAGDVAADSLKILRSTPRGVRAVTNPLPAAGGTDGEPIEELRAAVPRRTALIDRVVSLRDHEVFARSQAGVAKARARSFWDGARRVVHLTVTGSTGDPLSGDAKGALRAALTRVRDGGGDLAFDDCEKRGVRVQASLRVDAARSRESVLAAAEVALREALSAPRREIAQPLWASDVVAVLQGVPGVVSVRLIALFLAPARPGDVASDADMTSVRLNDALPALDVRQVVRAGRLVVEPSQLLVIDDTAAGVVLTFNDQESRR